MWRLAATALIAATITGCGYSWQGKANPWRDSGVQRVYIRTMENSTLSAGVEVPFTSALVREFARGEKLKLVADEREADAFIAGVVETAGSSMSAQSTVGQIAAGADREIADMAVASEYVAQALIRVQLVRRRDGKILWSQQFSQSRIYPANNRYGLPGTTNSLINDSQEKIALGDIAVFIASDIHDAMLEAF